MLFFFDNNLSPFLARALNELCKNREADVHHLRDDFSTGASDEEWIKDLSQRKDPWIVVTSDQLRKSRAEKKLVKDSGLVWFFLAPGWSQLEFWDQSWKLVKAWSQIMKHAERAERNSCFLVQVGGKIVPL